MIIVKIMARNLCSGCLDLDGLLCTILLVYKPSVQTFFFLPVDNQRWLSFHILFCWMVYVSITLVCSSGAVLVLRKKMLLSKCIRLASRAGLNILFQACNE